MEDPAVKERREAFRVDVRLPLIVKDIREEKTFTVEIEEKQEEGLSMGEAPVAEGVSPSLWNLLKGLEKKLDRILEQLPEDLLKVPAQKVNLSSSGMRFRYNKALEVNQPVRVKMILFSFPTQEILLEGKVVRIEPQGEGYYEVAMCFNDMNEETRKVLFQYLLTQQRKDIAQKRQNDDG